MITVNYGMENEKQVVGHIGEIVNLLLTVSPTEYRYMQATDSNTSEGVVDCTNLVWDELDAAHKAQEQARRDAALKEYQDKTFYDTVSRLKQMTYRDLPVNWIEAQTAALFILREQGWEFQLDTVMNRVRSGYYGWWYHPELPSDAIAPNSPRGDSQPALMGAYEAYRLYVAEKGYAE